jgi:hypothetical protein
MSRYLGIGKQTAFGTGVAPTKFIDASSLTLTPQFEKAYPQTLSYRAPVAFFPGQKYSETEFEAYLWPEGGWENILHAFFQNVTTTTLDATNGVYQHVFTPAALNTTPTYYTLEAGFDPGLQALRAKDCVVDSIEFSFSSEDPPTASIAAVGGEASAVSRATPSYPAVRPFQNPDTSLLIGGSAAELQELTIELNNNLERQHDLAAALRAIELQNLEVSGSFSVRFRDATHLNRFLNASETSLKVTLTGPVAGGSHNYRLEVELARIVYDAWEAEISEAELLVQDVDFQALKPSTDDVMKVTLVNKVSSI